MTVPAWSGVLGMFLLGALALGLPGGPASGAPEAMEERMSATLQGLDKITARVSTFTVVVDRTVDFGSLRITLRSCRQAPPIAPPESAAFLQIDEAKPGEAVEALFSGWMFASSPALSALEHPVYDVWVIGCGEK